MNNTNYLISYRSEHMGVVVYGYEMYHDPIAWVASVQDLPGIYILLNAQPMNLYQAARYDGMFKGM